MEEATKTPYSKFYQPENENFIDIQIEMEGFMTMVDGLLVNVINDCPNSNSCPFCHLNQKDFNNPLKNIHSTVKVDSYIEVGMSILHFGPNTMKGLFKLASQMDFKKHRCEGPENQALRDKRRDKINKLLYEKIGVKCDLWFNVTGII